MTFKKAARRLSEALPHAIDTAAWKLEEFGRVSYMGRLAYGKQEELPDSTWTYPNSTAVLHKFGL